MLQFVDDTFVMQSSAAGLRSVNRALGKFCVKWRHCFKGGSKRPTVLPFNCPGLVPESLGVIAGGNPIIVDKIAVLGTWLDQGLALQPQLDQVRSRLVAQSNELVSTMGDLGFGLPMVVSQFSSRVEASAMHGAEILASYSGGWREAAKRLNEIHYQVAKQMLGLPHGFSLGTGGHVKAFSETRFTTRLGARLAQRIILARARLLSLPDDSPVNNIILGASEVTGSTWMDHARIVTQNCGIEPGSAWDFVRYSGLTDADINLPASRKAKVKRWKIQVVAPRIRRMEEDWFREQLVLLGSEGVVPLQLILPTRQPTFSTIWWAPWGKTMWRLFRARSVARITAGIPLVVWGFRATPPMMKFCPLCCHVNADMKHYLDDCQGTEKYRQQWGLESAGHSWHTWAMSDCWDKSEMKCKVRYLGLCISTLAHALAFSTQPA